MSFEVRSVILEPGDGQTVQVPGHPFTYHGTSGSFILIPRGTVHTFWNAGALPAKFLVIVSPPGIEQFLAEVIGEGEIDTDTFIERSMALASKHNMEIVRPSLG
jgi:hypothetical protein